MIKSSISFRSLQRLVPHIESVGNDDEAQKMYDRQVYRYLEDMNAARPNL